MNVKLEVGKRYVRRDGKITGELVGEDNKWFPFRDTTHQCCYHIDGSFDDGEETSIDLISEYKEDNVKQDDANPLETQVGGDHYKNLAIQPSYFSEVNGLSFLEGCVVKRICRYKAKNGKEDLLKAKHEIDLLIAINYPEES